jgi:hypothetical protein
MHPTCHRCDQPAVVHWQRRLIQAEIDDLRTAEQGRRDQAVLLADPQQPPPTFGPLPDGRGHTRIVHACAQHAISLDDAALIHQPDCTACDCTPEPQPGAEPITIPGPALPPGWDRTGEI